MKKFLIKSQEASITNYGKYPGSRTVQELLNNGIIVLDKPSGPTSHQVDAWMKEILGINKCSHGGTLDPRVSGVLVIALENATKLMPILLSCNKEYVALVNFHKEVPKEKIKEACKEFVGEIKQLPPLKSAVARRVRKRQIYYIDILEIDGRNLLIRVGCEAGTYIRRLAEDIGKKIGVDSHMQELRRTKSGIFDESKVITIQELMDIYEDYKKGDDSRLRDVLLPVESVIEPLGKVIIKDSAVDAICNGAPLTCSGLSRIEEDINIGEWVAVLTLKGELVAIGKARMDSSQMFSLSKGIAVKTDRVLMKRDTYPKMWKEH